MASIIKASALKPGYSTSGGPSLVGAAVAGGAEGSPTVFSTSAGVELTDISAASPMLDCWIGEEDYRILVGASREVIRSKASCNVFGLTHSGDFLWSFGTENGCLGKRESRRWYTM